MSDLGEYTIRPEDRRAAELDRALIGAECVQDVVDNLRAAGWSDDEIQVAQDDPYFPGFPYDQLD